MTTKTTHNMGRLSWYNTDEISAQCLRALPNRNGILKNDIFIEAVRCILGLPSHILQPFLDGHHFIGRNATVVDVHGIMVKNAMLINGDYHRMHASIQSLLVDMFKKANMGNSRTAKHVSWPCPSRDSQRVLLSTFDQRVYHSRHNDLRPSTSRKVWTSDTIKTNFRGENDASR